MPDHSTLDILCRSLPHAEASSPFGPETVVYKVGGKMFAALSLDTPRLNLKCDPEVAASLRERYACVAPGYHMNKRHWNSIHWEREPLSAAVLSNWLNHSYALVFSSLTAKLRKTLHGGADVAARNSVLDVE